MEDARPRCPIFCITEIPPSIIEKLVEETEEHRLGFPELFANQPLRSDQWLVLMTSKDLTTIHRGVSSPVQPFTSPFVGMSVDEVAAWYDTNITQPDVPGYLKSTFIVLEGEAIDDEVCTIVCTAEEPAGQLRSDFPMAMQIVCNTDQDCSTEEGIMGSYKRSGVVITKDNFELACNGGMYMDGLEVKVNEAWRNFSDW